MDLSLSPCPRTLIPHTLTLILVLFNLKKSPPQTDRYLYSHPVRLPGYHIWYPLALSFVFQDLIE